MDPQSAPNLSRDSWTRHLHAMETDLKFIRLLLESPIYSGKSPNLFERLQHYDREASEFQTELQQLDRSREGDLSGFQARFRGWKASVFEYLQSQLMANPQG